MERVTGIEPAFSAWEADVLPLNYTRGTSCRIQPLPDSAPPRTECDRVPSGGGLSGVMPGVAQVPVVMPVPGVVSVSRVVSSSASEVSVR